MSQLARILVIGTLSGPNLVAFHQGLAFLSVVKADLETASGRARRKSLSTQAFGEVGITNGAPIFVSARLPGTVSVV